MLFLPNGLFTFNFVIIIRKIQAVVKLRFRNATDFSFPTFHFAWLSSKTVGNLTEKKTRRNLIVWIKVLVF